MLMPRMPGGIRGRPADPSGGNTARVWGKTAGRWRVSASSSVPPRCARVPATPLARRGTSSEFVQLTEFPRSFASPCVPHLRRRKPQ
jgi:hypothetical protein